MNPHQQHAVRQLCTTYKLFACENERGDAADKRLLALFASSLIQDQRAAGVEMVPTDLLRSFMIDFPHILARIA